MNTQRRSDDDKNRRKGKNWRRLDEMEVPGVMKELDTILQHQRNLLLDLAQRVNQRPLSNNPLWSKLSSQRRPDTAALWESFIQNIDDIIKLTALAREECDAWVPASGDAPREEHADDSSAS